MASDTESDGKAGEGGPEPPFFRLYAAVAIALVLEIAAFALLTAVYQ